MPNTKQTLVTSEKTGRILRGELWLGSRLFQELGQQDDLQSRRRLCHDFGMDMMFLPISRSFFHADLFGYRYFTPEEVRQFLAENHDLLVGLVVDGPFELLAREVGLQSLLHQWHTTEIAAALQNKSGDVDRLFSACLACKPDLLVIADDIAYNRTTYVSPKDLEEALFILYKKWVGQAHDHSAPIFFHSDGNLSNIISGLLACGFDGLAGIELECQDVPALKSQHGSRLTLLAGIPTKLLDGELGPAQHDQFIERVTSLALGGRFFLGSSSGLSSAQHLSKLKILYQWADELVLT